MAPFFDNSTRREFIKKSALSVGAMALLSRGTALANPEGISGSSNIPRMGHLLLYTYTETESDMTTVVTAANVNEAIMAAYKSFFTNLGNPKEHSELVQLDKYKEADPDSYEASSGGVDVENLGGNPGGNVYEVKMKGPATVKLLKNVAK